MGEIITGYGAARGSKSIGGGGRIQSAIESKGEESPKMPFFCNEELSLHYLERGKRPTPACSPC